jgi:uncharacterized protein involved in cysteine biosynthesis
MKTLIFVAALFTTGVVANPIAAPFDTAIPSTLETVTQPSPAPLQKRQENWNLMVFERTLVLT